MYIKFNAGYTNNVRAENTHISPPNEHPILDSPLSIGIFLL